MCLKTRGHLVGLFRRRRRCLGQPLGTNGPKSTRPPVGKPTWRRHGTTTTRYAATNPGCLQCHPQIAGGMRGGCIAIHCELVIAVPRAVGVWLCLVDHYHLHVILHPFAYSVLNDPGQRACLGIQAEMHARKLSWGKGVSAGGGERREALVCSRRMGAVPHGWTNFKGNNTPRTHGLISSRQITTPPMRGPTSLRARTALLRAGRRTLRATTYSMHLRGRGSRSMSWRPTIPSCRYGLLPHSRICTNPSCKQGSLARSWWHRHGRKRDSACCNRLSDCRMAVLLDLCIAHRLRTSLCADGNLSSEIQTSLLPPMMDCFQGLIERKRGVNSQAPCHAPASSPSDHTGQEECAPCVQTLLILGRRTCIYLLTQIWVLPSGPG